MNWYTVGWIGWAAFFVGLETAAILTRDKDADEQYSNTLSSHIWRWLKVRDPRPTKLTWAIRIALVLSGFWLTTHLAFGWFSF